MLTKNIKELFNYFQEGFYSKENHEEALKTYLIYSFSFVGFIFLFILGLNGIHTSNSTLTISLLGGSALLMLNLMYLKITQNYIISGYIALYLFFALMVYLVYSGGVANTGPLWIYALPPVALYIHGFKRGLFDLSIFILLISFILFYPDQHVLKGEYTHAFKVRIILSFILLVFFSAVYGYSRERSSDKMKKMKKDLEFFLRRDELTGLYNRRGYQDNMQNIQDSFGAILMCDIDHFKKVNDTYGNAVGDFTIKEISQCIKNNLRKDDMAVRWGGEEFFIFLPEITIDNAYMVSEKLRVSIENNRIFYNDNIVFYITMSIGISELNAKIPLEHAIKNSDNAMYRSKSQGRNKSTIFNRLF